ncbi:hypothetical protein LB553_05745 [Mesorhizobium sp. CA8]|uniref:hypothetical protein n=1 Tax=Mesorhizobium sp. CA8 TaxID=2876637 RepID=UPI001CC96646|nr:hypothetical protein [Mesorhizobium sp. CA8]MBZ9760378.1 hypothetical protein [Mesorhizobium sp. CA8]
MNFRRSLPDQRRQHALVVAQRPLSTADTLGQPFGIAGIDRLGALYMSHGGDKVSPTGYGWRVEGSGD